MFYALILCIVDFVDLEDIQKKRRKQIPNFANSDVFMNGIGIMSAFCDSFC